MDDLEKRRKIIAEMERKGQLYTVFWTSEDIRKWVEEIISKWEKIRREKDKTAGYIFLSEEFHKLSTAAFLENQSDVLTPLQLARLIPSLLVN